jgi:murein L,D-transpeptidase YcbB/YkuD
MRAEDARNMTKANRAVDYIARAASQGKTRVEIPKELVDRNYLESQGYRVIGSSHQLADSVTVSWERHWRD